MNNPPAQINENYSRQICFTSQPVPSTVPEPYTHLIHSQDPYRSFAPPRVDEFRLANFVARQPYGMQSHVTNYPRLAPHYLQFSGPEPQHMYSRIGSRFPPENPIPPYFDLNSQSYFYPPNLNSIVINYRSNQYNPFPQLQIQRNMCHTQQPLDETTPYFKIYRPQFSQETTQDPSELLPRTTLLVENPKKTPKAQIKCPLLLDIPEKANPKGCSPVESRGNSKSKRFDLLSRSVSSQSENSIDHHSSINTLRQNQPFGNRSAISDRKTTPPTLFESQPMELKPRPDSSFDIKTFSVRKTEVIELVKRSTIDQKEFSKPEPRHQSENSKLECLTIQSKRVKAFWASVNEGYPSVFKYKFGVLHEFGPTAHSIEVIDLSRKMLTRD